MPYIEPKVLAVTMPISRSILAGPTDPAVIAERRAEHERRSVAYVEQMRVFRDAMASLDWDVSRAVLDLHRHNDHGECMECQGEDPAEWPCSTVEVVARAHGVEVPSW